MRGITVTADSSANVKGYVLVPQVMLPPNAMGKLDVGGAVGPGMLSVIKDMGLKEPYVGQIELQTGEIADDLTYYFAVSEQVPSTVGLGVLMNKDNTVSCAGGFIIQLMPFAEDELITKLEEKLSTVTSVTGMLSKGMTPEMILEELLGEFGLEILDKIPTCFTCNCSKHKVEKVLISLGKEELEDIIKDDKGVDLNCQFCNTDYHFDTEELKRLYKASK